MTRGLDWRRATERDLVYDDQRNARQRRRDLRAAQRAAIPPTDKQLAYLEVLRQRAGKTGPLPGTRDSASAEIAALKLKLDRNT